jgi:hypothetical protein
MIISLLEQNRLEICCLCDVMTAQQAQENKAIFTVAVASEMVLRALASTLMSGVLHVIYLLYYNSD